MPRCSTVLLLLLGEEGSFEFVIVCFSTEGLLNAIADPYSSLIQPAGQSYRVKRRAADSGSGAGSRLASSRLIGWADSGNFSL